MFVLKKYLRLTWFFAALALLLSHVMCAAAAYQFCALQWCGHYAGCSAPPSTALLLCFPYGTGIVICAVLARIFYKKYLNFR